MCTGRCNITEILLKMALNTIESILGNGFGKDEKICVFPDDSDGISPDGLKKTASPKPNQIVREPPDGCEKAIVVDEDRY